MTVPVLVSTSDMIPIETGKHTVGDWDDGEDEDLATYVTRSSEGCVCRDHFPPLRVLDQDPAIIADATDVFWTEGDKARAERIVLKLRSTNSRIVGEHTAALCKEAANLIESLMKN